MISKRLLFEDNKIITTKLNEKDNVSVIISSDKYKAYVGHKVATSSIKEGETIIKYGMPIGRANRFIVKGEHIHTHNIKTNLSDTIDYEYKPSYEPLKMIDSDKTFMGYKRVGGNVGIRNELWIIPTVGCVNGITEQMVKLFNKKHDLSDNFDGVHTFTHAYGCSQMGKDHLSTKMTLQNIARHPNAGGVLVVGLGCENNQLDTFVNTLGIPKDRLRYFNTSEVEDELEVGDKYLEDLYQLMQKDFRSPCPISDLNIGLECGGSDGFSGITANPLVGLVSDYIISRGGSTVLTEVPEMFGAETRLMERCISKDVFLKTVEMINEFKNYYKSHGQVIYENPSPGNKDGGITTLEDKSLGCTEKSGRSPVVDVLKFHDRISQKGLNLLNAPGNDIVATTALGTSGCQMVLFTTGRGTPFGGFIPTLKISTTSALYKRKKTWIDFNAGSLVEGVSSEEVLNDLIDYILEVASGKWVNNEKNDFRAIGMFKTGVIL
ncbi:altronate dehydratase [Acidaminobacter sp. JC074]|uniref:UxaA family hydrolase n=1 Tax=Acidaminobacter sp. JC074 TaxID=2530199 RepID=UPI001F116C46|nr:altronate dehydratase family protein [Acidaminobacter sp. JC074]MCH4887011.1 altronate dehydratase [Acidaminobacter sp. JC074]